MSINSAMLSGVSGLIANSAALGAISDNIANVNTVGYKENSTQFEDLVTAKASAGNYNSGGVQAQVTQLVSGQGQFQQTTNSTDMGINGNGMFVVADTSAGITATDGPSFTRAGEFTPDKAGYLVNSGGLYLQGWVANSSGIISTDPSDLSKLSTININSISNSPDPTTTATLSANLNSALYPTDPTASASSAVLLSQYDPASAGNSMAAYDQDPTTGVKPDYSTQLTVYDTEGGAHTVQMDFLKKDTPPNTWYVEMNAIPASDIDAAAAKPALSTGAAGNGQLMAGTITFNTDGTFNSTSMVASAAVATPTLPGVSTPGAGSLSLTIPWDSTLGVTAQPIVLNLNSAAGGLTQYASASTTNSDTVNGGPSATVTGIKVTGDGYVQASFSNGTSRNIAQVAIATFVNSNGLSAVSGNAYKTSGASGNYTLKSPGEGSAGSIEASQLESSTVDLSSEFTGLIVTQRAYSAASKIITTADQMLQELISVKQ